MKLKHKILASLLILQLVLIGAPRLRINSLKLKPNRVVAKSFSIKNEDKVAVSLKPRLPRNTVASFELTYANDNLQIAAELSSFVNDLESLGGAIELVSDHSFNNSEFSLLKLETREGDIFFVLESDGSLYCIPNFELFDQVLYEEHKTLIKKFNNKDVALNYLLKHKFFPFKVDYLFGRNSEVKTLVFSLLPNLNVAEVNDTSYEIKATERQISSVGIIKLNIDKRNRGFYSDEFRRKPEIQLILRNAGRTVTTTTTPTTTTTLRPTPTTLSVTTTTATSPTITAPTTTIPIPITLPTPTPTIRPEPRPVPTTRPTPITLRPTPTPTTRPEPRPLPTTLRPAPVPSTRPAPSTSSPITTTTLASLEESTLSIVIPAYTIPGGSVIRSTPAGIRCPGGAVQGCSARFPLNSYVDILFPRIIIIGETQLFFSHYRCSGEIGRAGQRGVNLRMTEDKFCRPIYQETLTDPSDSQPRPQPRPPITTQPPVPPTTQPPAPGTQPTMPPAPPATTRPNPTPPTRPPGGTLPPQPPATLPPQPPVPPTLPPPPGQDPVPPQTPTPTQPPVTFPPTTLPPGGPTGPGKRLQLIGGAFSGAPIYTTPSGIDCNGGEDPGCVAYFNTGSRVTIHFPLVIDNSLTFDHYECGSRTSTQVGEPGRRDAVVFMSENTDCIAYYGQNGGKLLRLVGSSFAGAPIYTEPRGITSCNGGNGSNCQARFATGSRVTIFFPPTADSRPFDHYECIGENTTQTGQTGRREAVVFMSGDVDCTAYYGSGSSGVLLRLTGGSYSGAPTYTTPNFIASCNGGGGPNCQALVPPGAEITIHFPRYINNSRVFDHYECFGNLTNIYGQVGRREATIYPSENTDCTAFYR